MSADTADSEDLQPGDLLVDTASETTQGTILRLIRCPICFEDLRERRTDEIDDHIAEHTPEEAGLTDRPTVGVDMELSPYAHAEAVLLDALRVDTDPLIYHPIADIHEEVLAAVAELEPVGYDEIDEATPTSTSATKRALAELEAGGWVDRAGKGFRNRVLFELRPGDSYEHLSAHEHPEVVEVIRDHTPASAQTVADYAGISKNAARARIKALEAEGSVEFIGKGRNGSHLYATTDALEEAVVEQ